MREDTAVSIRQDKVLKGPGAQLQAAAVVTPELDEGLWQAWKERGRRRDRRSAEQTTLALNGLLILVLLAVAVFGPFDPRVETALRWSIVLTATLSSVRFWGAGKYGWSAVSGALALLYNPLAPAFGWSQGGERALVACTAVAPLAYIFRSRAGWRALSQVGTIAILSGALCWATAGLLGAGPETNLSKYRVFQLGSSLPEVAKLAGVDASQARVIHRRPALIQELEWQPLRAGSSIRIETVKSVNFRFYQSELFQIDVNYDPYETEGMTAEDVIEAIATNYGPAVRPAVDPNVSGAYSLGGESLARWEDAEYRMDLMRFTYGPSFRLVCIAKKNEGAARSAIIAANRLDEDEAPQREAERAKTEDEAKRVKSEKARLANKPRFRP